MNKNILIIPENGQWLAGYITYTITDKDNVAYGLFNDLETALKWADNLVNAVVIPVYEPVFNRG